MKYAQLIYSVKNDKTTYQWDGEAHLPINLGEQYFIHTIFKQPFPYPWTFKIIEIDKFAIPPRCIAVRTDIQPFWWIVVLAQYRLERHWTETEAEIFKCLYLLGLMEIELGQIPSWKDFKFDWQFALNVTWSLLGAIATLCALLHRDWINVILRSILTTWFYYLARQRSKQLIRQQDTRIYRRSVLEIVRVYNLEPLPEELEACLEERLTVDEMVNRCRSRSKKQEQLIWNESCQYFSNNSYLHCAVNPKGACEECPQYQPIL